MVAAMAEKWESIVQQQTALLISMQEQIKKMTKTSIQVPWPTPINTNIDPAEAFKTFRSAWNNYSRAMEMDDWNQEQEIRKVSILFSAIGEEALKKYANFGLSDIDKENKTCTEILSIISKKMLPKKNTIYNRYMFLSKTQMPNETFDVFYAGLCKLVEECDYSNKEEMLRDKIVLGTNDPAIKKEMLKRDNLTLSDAVNLCRAAEATEKHMKDISNAGFSEIKKIDKKTPANIIKKSCKFCGNKHIFKKELCPAWGQTCEICKGKNHLKKVCKKKKNIKELKENKEEKEQSNSSDSEDEYVINKIFQENNKNLAECTLRYKSNNNWKEIQCLLDTAADDNIIGIMNARKMFGEQHVREKMRPSKKTLFSFSGHNIMIHGELDITLKTNIAGRRNKYIVTFQVVHNTHIPILSCKSCTQMGLVKFCKEVRCNYSQETQNIISNYSSIFEGQGRFSGEIDLEIDETVLPVIQKARRIPVALRPMLKEELKRLEKEGVIVKEDNHTEWVSNILIIKKKDSFRICLDPIPLNKAIKRPNHQYTTVEEILPELGRAKVFSTFDVRKGFWHLNLSESSSKLTTFWTPFGKYRWKVLPFGISSAPDYFQIKMSEIIQGLKGVEALVDDLLVWGIGDTLSEAILDHNINLENLLRQLKKYNCKLNKNKTKLLQKSVKYYGHIFTDKGLEADPAKIESVSNIPVPKNKKELQRFLGMATYLSRFIPNLSAESSYLRSLTHDKTEWKWNGKAQNEFMRLKSLLSDLKTLKYYDKNEPLVVECDSSEGALGVALFQNNQPVAYASRCLTPTEKKYAQIEKELLAVVFACTRFDQLIVGNSKTIIKTDHKPLLNIFKKPLLHAPKRLQSMLLALQRYCLELQFVSGKDNIMADALSRFYLECKDIDKSKDMKIFEIIEKVNPLYNLPISDNCITEIESSLTKDHNLMTLKSYIEHGWPKYLRDVPDSLKAYYNLKSELTIYQGLILKNHAILIPEELRTVMLKKLHKAHSGIENTLKLARDAIFWPSMSNDIKEMIQSCPICIKYQPCQQKFTMQSHKIPEYPFQIVSMDVFFYSHKGKQIKYLITVDHYSDFFEIDKLKDLSSKPVIEACKKNFSRHGVPETVVTDGGTNFVNQEFTQFAEDWKFIHSTSSPHHPQGNGKAEATVKIAKKLLIKATESGEDFWLSLLSLRNTPNKLNSSPVQRLFSRRTRGFLPTVKTLLEPKVVNNVPEEIKNKRIAVKHSHDKRAKLATPLEVGQAVSVQVNPALNKTWSPGIVSDVLSDRSYLVDVNDTTYRRDLLHIRPESYNVNQEPHQNQSFQDTEQNNSLIPQQTSNTQIEVDNKKPLANQDDTLNSSLTQGNIQSSSSNLNVSANSPKSFSVCPSSPIVSSNKSSKRESKRPAYLKDYVC